MKKSVLSLSFIFAAFSMNAQITTAQDWTETDCNGTPHTLYTYLNNSEVVVMMFHMGCSSCVSAGIALEGIKQEYDISDPGLVNFFAMDYWIGHTCVADGTPFATDNGLTYPSFIGAKPVKDYYTTASPMPMIVVAAGTSHTVFYIKNSFNPSGTDSTNIFNAIGNGLNSMANGVNESDLKLSTHLYPNPSERSTMMSFTLSQPTGVSIDLTNVLGKKIVTLLNENKTTGTHKVQIDTESLVSGIYFVTVKTSGASKTIKLVVK